MNTRERTFLMVKPDGVQRALIGSIISRMEQKGLKLVAMKLMQITPDLAARHYGEHKGKPFYEGLLGFITSSPVVAMIWEGDDVIEMTRTLIGATDPRKAVPGSIRGDLAVFTGKNIVHGSDSLDSAKREIGLFFRAEELCSYSLPHEDSLYE
ncbi:MAG: nucleoside-diphosphate kinase [Clostridia bacterium]|nr:nucleoside-diphosphate kinase [Clostridia bacterium]